MGSNFGSVPYNNTVGGNLSESHFSMQNSRLGFRIDGDWKGAHFIGYNEFDFNGTSGATNYGCYKRRDCAPPSPVLGRRPQGQGEFLAGQSWSMMMPNRKGISALPGDLFYTPSHRHQLHCGSHLDASTRRARSASPEPKR